MNDQKYINELCVCEATILRAFERARKGQSKEACYLEFGRKDGAICSMRFSSPLTASDLYRISKLIKELKGKFMKADELIKFSQAKLIESLDAMKGTLCNIYVRPHEWDTGKGMKTIWGVEDVVNARYKLSNSVPDAPAVPQTEEELPF